MANETETTSDTGVATNDAYTGMLAISLIALIAGSVLLFLDYSQHSGKPPPVPPLTAAPAPVPPKAEGKKDEGKLVQPLDKKDTPEEKKGP
jgi:hypothetical protein